MRLNLGVLMMAAVVTIATSACGPDCDDLKQEARELKDAYATCSSNDTCVIVDMYSLAGANNCLPAFQCSAAVREGADIDAFGAKARTIAGDYDDCSECAMAGCTDPSQLRAECNANTGRCEIVR